MNLQHLFLRVSYLKVTKKDMSIALSGFCSNNQATSCVEVEQADL